MYIITGNDNIDDIQEKYTVLELDTFKVDDNYIPTYCVVDHSSISISDMGTLKSSTELHANLIKNYKIGNWNFCNKAIDHLHGKFNGELDSFYDTFRERINVFVTSDTPYNWTGAIDQSK